MGQLVQALVYGLTIGSVYALVALGYSLIFSATGIVNFAQGTMVVFGGYLAWWLYDQAFATDVPLAVVLVLVVLLAGLSGVAVYLAAVAPLGRFDPKTNIGWLVTTFGAGIVIQELVAKLVSDEGQTVPDLVGSLFGWRGSVVQDVAIGPSDAVLVGVTVLIVVGLEALQLRTRIGLAFRAVAQDRSAASLMGINPTTMIVVAFFVAGALAGLAGILVAPRLGIRFNIALNLGVAGFVAAVIGGLGSPRGAIVGGLLIGIVEGVVGVLSDSPDAYRPLAVFLVFVLLLAVRPTGLFGHQIKEKV
jgi:branched-subunit amino acid ABC-type transport system permease component